MEQNPDISIKPNQPITRQKEGVRVVYRFRVQSIYLDPYGAHPTRTLTIKCYDPANVVAALARKGWIVQTYYEV